MKPSDPHDAARRLAQLHAEHYERRSPLQRAIESIKDSAARPWLLCTIIGLCFAWIGFHVYGAIAGRSVHVDENWLQTALGFAALIMTSLILTGQRQDELLEEQRSEMILHLIAVIERRLAAALPETGKPVEPEEALSALQKAHSEVGDDSLRD
ncbi:MAG: hypothetical protein ACRENA_00490 [Vulcanimicrobiaceae bacterium]